MALGCGRGVSVRALGGLGEVARGRGCAGAVGRAGGFAALLGAADGFLAFARRGFAGEGLGEGAGFPLEGEFVEPQEESDNDFKDECGDGGGNSLILGAVVPGCVDRGGETGDEGASGMFACFVHVGKI